MDKTSEGFFFGRLFKKLENAVHPNRRPNRHQKRIHNKQNPYKNITEKKTFIVNYFSNIKKT